MKRKIMDILLFALCIFVCLPILMVVMGSIKSSRELQLSFAPILGEGEGFISFHILPLYPTLNHYGKLLFYTPQFYTVFWNSIQMTGAILLGQLLVAVPGAWALARFSFRGKRLLLLLYIILMLMPFQVTMLPSYLVLDKLHLMNTPYAVILPAIFSTFPVFIIYRGFTIIPEEILEAARVDGADDRKAFFYVGIPIGQTGILSAMVLGFLEYWNMLEQPLVFLKDKTLWPLSLYLPEIDFNQGGTALAVAVITLIPAAFVFVMGQDYLEQGIAMSGMKE